MNSLSPPRSKPSAMLDMMEMEAPRIWPRSSKSFAKLPCLEASYTCCVSSRAFCQLNMSSNRVIFAIGLFFLLSVLVCVYAFPKNFAHEDLGHWTLDFGHWTLNHWTLDFGHWTLNSFDNARRAHQFAFDLVEDAVDELAAVLGGKFFGDVHRFVDADHGRNVLTVEHL